MKKTSFKSKNETRDVENLLLSKYTEKNLDYIIRLKTELSQMEGKDQNEKKISIALIQWLQNNIKELKNIPEIQIQEIFKYSQIISFNKGQKIVKIGDKAEYFYLIISGYCSVFISIPSQISSKGYLHLTEIKKLEPMQTFGELGLIHPNGLRSSEIEAKTDCILIAVPREIYNKNLKNIVMNELNMLWGLIRQISYINHWNERDIANLIYKLPSKQYCLNQSVYSQGESPESGIFFILRGEFEIRRQIEVDVSIQQQRNELIDVKLETAAQKKQINVQIAVLSAGCSFGEEEVILNKKRESNIICISEGALVYQTTKNEFEKKFLWNQQTRESLDTLISQRQLWAHQKLKEFKKTKEISKEILLQKNMSEIFSPNSKHEKIIKPKDYEPAAAAEKKNKNQENSSSEFQQRVNSKSEYFSANKSAQNNEQNSRRLSNQVAGLDSMSLKQSMTIDILKDQNKLIGFESQDEDVHFNLNSFRNVQTIKREYSFSDQMASLIAENQQKSQKFDAINKEHLKKYCQQTASQLSNYSSKKFQNVPQLNENYKQNQGENVQKYIDRIKKSSHVKSVREEKKLINQQEIKKEIKEFTSQLLESFQNNQNFTPNNKETKICQNFVDFNFVRTQYKNRKIEEKQMQLQKINTENKEKLEQSPVIQKKIVSQYSPYQHKYQDQQSIFFQYDYSAKNLENQNTSTEQTDQKYQFTQQKSLTKSLSNYQQQYVSIPLYLQEIDQKLSIDTKAKQSERLVLPLEEKNKEKIHNKIKSKELRLYLINSQKMFQQFKEQRINDQFNQNIKSKQIFQPRSSFSQLLNQFNQESNGQNVETVNENTFKNQVINSSINKFNNKLDLVNNHKLIKQSTTSITHSVQDDNLKILPIVRNNSETTYKSINYQQQLNELNILNRLNIDEQCILNTKTTNIFNRCNQRNDINRSQFSQVDELELNDLNKEDAVFSTNHRNSISEQNSPILNPHLAHISFSRKQSQSQRQSFYKNSQILNLNSNTSFTNLHNCQLTQSNCFYKDSFNSNLQSEFSNQTKHLTNTIRRSKESVSAEMHRLKNQQKNFFNFSKKNTFLKSENLSKNTDLTKSFNHQFIIIDSQQNKKNQNFENQKKYQTKNNSIDYQLKQKMFLVKRNPYHN
ncbi:hypothetical protein ABPG74_014696 [Tetrahymena malaccensis]